MPLPGAGESMSYLTESILRTYSAERYALNEEVLLSKSAKSGVRSIFLSHSHQDRELVIGLQKLLVKVYKTQVFIDWQDSTMPRVTNRQTAAQIKSKIGSLDFFMILATQAALQSRWVPWEIGVADSCKPLDKIGIIPVADDSGRWDGNEYLQLYNRIELDDESRLGVFAPTTNRGAYLSSVLFG